MSIVQEIESAAARAASVVPLAGEVDPDIAAHDFVRTEYWARIKAALEAAMNMDSDLREYHDGHSELPSQRIFREAMGK